MTYRIAPFGLRMPDDLKEWAKKKASEEGRSVNNLIVRILKKEAAGEDFGEDAPAAGNDNAALAGGASINHGIGGATDECPHG